ncbi:MAG: HTH-type transcriptional repressor [Aeromicrobium sp.]|nr:HTH-type transcriptional repressor [Aeromicrobium sp.]
MTTFNLGSIRCLVKYHSTTAHAYGGGVTTPTRTPRARRGTARPLLVEAARALFAERGYGGATTRLIAERAGVSEDLIFRYYRSKSGLLAEAVLRPLMQSIDRLKHDWTDVVAMQDLSDEAFVRWFVEGVYGLVTQNESASRAMSLLLTEQANDPEFELLRESFGQLFEPLVSTFGEQMRRRAFRRGEIELQLRLLVVHIATAATFLPTTYRGAEPPSRQAVIDELTRSILGSLRTL